MCVCLCVCLCVCVSVCVCERETVSVCVCESVRGHCRCSQEKPREASVLCPRGCRMETAPPTGPRTKAPVSESRGDPRHRGWWPVTNGRWRGSPQTSLRDTQGRDTSRSPEVSLRPARGPRRGRPGAAGGTLGVLDRGTGRGGRGESGALPAHTCLSADGSGSCPFPSGASAHAGLASRENTVFACVPLEAPHLFSHYSGPRTRPLTSSRTALGCLHGACDTTT